MAVGALVPFRPFIMDPGDPATGTIDLFLTPAYSVGRILPRMSSVGETAFYSIAILSNAILYGIVTYIAHRWLTKGD
jgi:hypothetical protein